VCVASDDNVSPYSFVNVCALLGLDAECVRRALGGKSAA
jgi:hypothetical protein